MQDPGYFVNGMRVADDRLGVEWPNRVDFSADGLCFIFLEDAAKQLGRPPENSMASTMPDHSP